jgi:hypothetical protein
VIGVDVDTRPAARLLSAVRGRVERPRPVLDALADELVEREARAFATNGFGRWGALAPATVRAKGHGRVLVDTGGLLRQLTSRTAVRVTGSSVEVSTNHAGAYFNRVGARGMPKRDAVPHSTSTEREEWASTALGFFVTGERR